MSLDPTTFDSTTYETANEVVLFCYEALRNADLKVEYNRLRGLLPVSNRGLCVEALSELRVIRLNREVLSNKHLVEAINIAIDAVTCALSQREFLAAS